MILKSAGFVIRKPTRIVFEKVPLQITDTTLCSGTIRIKPSKHNPPPLATPTVMTPSPTATPIQTTTSSTSSTTTILSTTAKNYTTHIRGGLLLRVFFKVDDTRTTLRRLKVKLLNLR